MFAATAIALRFTAPAAPMTDDDLLASVRRGDPDALRRLHAAHAATVARVIARMGFRADEVDDLVQATFLELCARPQAFEGRGSVRAYLVGIALNQTRTWIRSRVRGRVALRRVAADEAHVPPASVEAERAEDVDRLRAAMAKLSDTQREALVLCEIDGLPGKDVAALLGVPVSTVWRRIHDAKITLRRLLEEDA